MSGPTWLPPRTLGTPESVTPAMAHQATGPTFYRAQKKMLVDSRPKYGGHEQNGGAPIRYIATAPTGAYIQHADESGDHYYPSSHGSKDERTPWNPHMGAYDLQTRDQEKHHSTIDAEIDSLTCMLADMDSHPHNASTQLYDNVPYSKHSPGDRYKSHGHPSMGYPPQPQTQYHPSASYSSNPQASHYNSKLDYTYQSPLPPPASSSTPSPASSTTAAAAFSHHKPYPQPVPASYTTASTPTGPRFSVQVKTAQPVSTYSQTGRQAEQAYTPPPPRQPHLSSSSRPPYHDHLSNQAQPLPQQKAHHQQQPGWYSMPPPASQDVHGEGGYAMAGAGGLPSGRAGQQGFQLPKKGPDTSMISAGGSSQQSSKGPVPRPEEELDRLTKKLVYDMNHPPTEEFFGRCARCGENVLGDGSGCVAMDQVFHVECFTCITCHARLRGQPFYALDKKSYCESCYISTLERCSKCSNPILDRILRAMGKAYHPRCFTCVVCNCCLDGVPFTVDAASHIHCIEDFHRKFAPRCSVCGQPIMPEPGQEETVRIVALDRSFHVNCYKCEECGLLLSSEGEGRGCYPLDGHILCKSCSARRIQDLSAKISTDC